MASFRKKVMAAASDQAQELVDAFVQGKTYARHGFVKRYGDNMVRAPHN